MKDQLILLLQLQRIDSRVREVRASITALPEKIAPAKQDLAKLEAMLQAEKDRLAETEAWKAEQEELIRQDDEALKKAKTKVQAAKSTKDFAAASREVDNKRRSKSDRESEVLKVMEALEKSRADIDAHEKDVDTLRKHVSEEEAAITEQITALEADAAEHSAGRDEIVAKIEKRLMKRYEQTIKRRGYAVAPVDNGTCQGCQMQIPPQLNNILARMESIEVCPHCHRLLFRRDALGDDADTALGSAGDGDS